MPGGVRFPGGPGGFNATGTLGIGTAPSTAMVDIQGRRKSNTALTLTSPHSPSLRHRQLVWSAMSRPNLSANAITVSIGLTAGLDGKIPVSATYRSRTP